MSSDHAVTLEPSQTNQAKDSLSAGFIRHASQAHREHRGDWSQDL